MRGSEPPNFKDYVFSLRNSGSLPTRISLQAAREKNAVLPDLIEGEEEIKRNSLKSTPMKPLLFLNGNVALQFTDPNIVGASQLLGYQWTKQFFQRVLVCSIVSNLISKTMHRPLQEVSTGGVLLVFMIPQKGR